MYDVIIVGAGPAGITAAIYAARKKLKVLVISKNIGGQAALSGKIENYTGYQFISGPELSLKFEEHLKEFDLELRENVEVKSIVKKEGYFIVETEEEKYETLTVIVSTGARPRMLNIPGEVEFKNRGVSYCATCDAPLFKGKDVAVIGGGNSALDAAIQLTSIAKRVYLITINDRMFGDEVMIEKVKGSDNVEIITNAETKEIIGDKFVTGIKIIVNGREERYIDVQGVFIEIGYVPAIPKVRNAELEVNERGEIVVNERCETNIPGLFAAGDVTNIPYKQIISSAGHGCIASLSAFEYISRKAR